MNIQKCLNCEKDFDMELEPSCPVHDGSEESNLIGHYCYDCYTKLIEQLG